MKDLRPVTPKNLDPLARELLEALAGHPESAEIVLGGGVALSHYLEYRPTVDVDAWWKSEANPDTREFLLLRLKEMAARHGLDFRARNWGETESFELLDGKRKTFSFQISRRTLYLGAPLGTSWSPVALEEFADNLASKMTALTERGAPRDFTDVHEVCFRGIATPAECWQFWQRKNPNQCVAEGKQKALSHLVDIERRRPLASVADAAERNRAERLRLWYHRTMCANDDT